MAVLVSCFRLSKEYSQAGIASEFTVKCVRPQCWALSQTKIFAIEDSMRNDICQIHYCLSICFYHLSILKR